MIGEVFLMFDDRWKPMYFFIGVLSKYNSKCMYILISWVGYLNIKTLKILYLTMCVYLSLNFYLYTLLSYTFKNIFDNKV
jgi:hypothetical protein